MRFIAARPNIYPYLLVNIGSGVSMVKVSGPRQYERVGGTSLGGGTLWGLLSLLTGARTFEDMLRLAEQGDNTAVDMLVGDIYGTDYGKIGLKSTTIASSFSKVYKLKRQAEQEAEDTGNLKDSSYDYGRSFKPEDVSKSLLYAVRYAQSFFQLPTQKKNPRIEMLTTFVATTSGRLPTSMPKSTTWSTYISAAPSSAATPKPCTRSPTPSSSGPRARSRPISSDMRVTWVPSAPFSRGSPAIGAGEIASTADRLHHLFRRVGETECQENCNHCILRRRLKEIG